jgi:hypothetical protein
MCLGWEKLAEKRFFIQKSFLLHQKKKARSIPNISQRKRRILVIIDSLKEEVFIF